MVFPTYGTTVSPSTDLRPAPVMGNKTRTTLPRPIGLDANSSIQQAEYPAVEGSGIPVEASSASGWEGPVDRAASVVMYVLGHNWTATVEGSRESVFEPRGNTEPQTLLRGILALYRGEDVNGDS
jgi:hypothetical protein